MPWPCASSMRLKLHSACREASGHRVAALCHPNQYARPALLAGEAFPPSDFYVEREDHVDVWRVLHGQRDIPAWLQIEE